jgi:uncharacterized membrane protein YcaP (DUF421 family)
MVGLQRLIAEVGIRNRRLQTRVSGDVALLFADGHLHLDALRSSAISRETVFGQVRTCGYVHLGQVSRIYIEPSGAFSIVPSAPIEPGLPVVPETDIALLNLMRQHGRACTSCGARATSFGRACSVCGKQDWAPARLAPEEGV